MSLLLTTICEQRVHPARQARELLAAGAAGLHAGAVARAMLRGASASRGAGQPTGLSGAPPHRCQLRQTGTRFPQWAGSAITLAELLLCSTAWPKQQWRCARRGAARSLGRHSSANNIFHRDDPPCGLSCAAADNRKHGAVDAPVQHFSRSVAEELGWLGGNSCGGQGGSYSSELHVLLQHWHRAKPRQPLAHPAAGDGGKLRLAVALRCVRPCFPQPSQFI